MQGLDTRCKELKERVAVLDTAAFLAGLQLSLYMTKLVTTPRVLEEVKDSESHLRLEMALEISRIEVVEPDEEYLEKARKLAQEIGALEKLSRTDLDVLALALQYSSYCYEVVVLTDDYTLQNAVTFAGLKFIPIKTRGIAKPRKFIKRNRISF